MPCSLPPPNAPADDIGDWMPLNVPRYALPNTASLLPEYANAEAEFIHRCGCRPSIRLLTLILSPGVGRASPSPLAPHPTPQSVRRVELRHAPGAPGEARLRTGSHIDVPSLRAQTQTHAPPEARGGA